ncbi:VOC family protein [Gimesia sp.]|uniref:VOC family protein n=1 Tax=Gimesia sp. TaxID=2024833 RepID=UPI000C4857EB|nr:VOC family protein [Gimesia sp.]MAX40340.1 glyxoylase [Gimesia sp.]HAH45691.1 glyxoylase [Planctomycetaceae bacterium]HBL42525.1 glyxoylase [Planctomycetaceae bacterium]
MPHSNTDSNQIKEVFPYLRTRDAAAAIKFYQRAFGAVEDFRLTEPGGRIGHAELKFGSATIMVSDEYPEYGIYAPTASTPTGSAIHLHVQDVDAMTQEAVQAGASLIMEPADQFYGERAAKIRDPFGHEWLLGSHIEDVTHEEMQRRFDAMFEEDSPEH